MHTGVCVHLHAQWKNVTAALAAGQSQLCSVTVAQSNIVDLKPQHEAMYGISF